MPSTFPILKQSKPLPDADLKYSPKFPLLMPDLNPNTQSTPFNVLGAEMGSRRFFGLKSKFLTLMLCLFFIAAVLSLIVTPARAQEAVDGNGESKSLVKDLGRSGKVILNKLRKDAASDVLAVESGLGVVDAFFASLSMNMVSEIGDEIFIIAALMIMRHPKSIVLSGALSALVVMTVLSTGIVRIRKDTNSAATVLYAFFGMQLLYIAWRSDLKSS